MAKYKQHGRWMPLLALVLLVGVVLLLALTAPHKNASAKSLDTTPDVAAGVAYLRQLEARDPAEVEAELKAIRKAEWEATLRAQRDEWLGKLENGEINIWSQFDDSVILGDSRAVGFDFYEFLPDERVLADSGGTIRNVAEHMEEIKSLNPSYIYLCYGLNDISIGFWTTDEAYLEEMKTVIASLQEAFPDATVCISSILVAREPAFQRSSAWRRLPELSEELRALCEELDIPFADNTQLCSDYAKLWEPDGIHVQPGLYSHWAINLVSEVYDYELGKLEAPTD